MKTIFCFLLLSVVSSLSAKEQSCANGTLKIEETNSGRYYEATISDQNFIAELKRKLASKVETQCSGYCSGDTRLITPVLPANTQLTRLNGEEVVVVTGLRYFVRSSERTYDAGQYQSKLNERDSGIDLFINGTEMTSAHTLEQYSTQHWFFPNCN